jgi:hypothetical protein
MTKLGTILGDLDRNFVKTNCGKISSAPQFMTKVGKSVSSTTHNSKGLNTV